MVNEALDVLERVAEEDADLMWKLVRRFPGADPTAELRDAARHVVAVIAETHQEGTHPLLLQHPLQMLRPVQVQQHPSLPIVHRHRPKAFPYEDPVHLPDVRPRLHEIRIRKTDQIRRFHPRQRRRAVLD